MTSCGESAEKDRLTCAEEADQAKEDWNDVDGKNL